MDVHHHDSGTGDSSTGAAALMMALVAFVIGIIVLVALVAWAPWDDDDGSASPVDQPGTEEGAPDTDVDIDGNIDIDGEESAPEGEQPEEGQ